MRRIRERAHIPAHLRKEHFDGVPTDPGNRIKPLDRCFKWAQSVLDLPVQAGNRPLLGVDHLQEFAQHKALVLMHSTTESLGERVALGRHKGSPQVSQFLGVDFSFGERSQDHPPGLAEHISQHRTQLEVGFLQEFVQAIDQARALLVEGQTVARQVTQFPLRAQGNEAGFEKAMLQQLSDPLGIFDVRVG